MQNKLNAAVSKKGDMYSTYLDLEKALSWIQQKRAAALAVSGDMLKAKAMDFTADFKAS